MSTPTPIQFKTPQDSTIIGVFKVPTSPYSVATAIVQAAQVAVLPSVPAVLILQK